MDLYEALEAAVRIADEARDEWDKAEGPPAPRAGKLLIALSGHCRGYRPDIDAIHATLAQERGRRMWPELLAAAAAARSALDRLMGDTDPPDDYDPNLIACRELSAAIDAATGATGASPFTQNPAPTPPRALRALELAAIMLEEWAPIAFPVPDQHGAKPFGRMVMESAAGAIRQQLALEENIP